MRRGPQRSIWEIAPTVSTRVRRKHEDVGLTGHHDWMHAFRVGEVARRVSKAEWHEERLSHLAGIAGLTHNADRILQREKGIGRRDVAPEDVATLVSTWVKGVLNRRDTRTVVRAVLQHDGRNSGRDARVLIALMDGDRIVNLDVDLLPRSGQFYHDLPAVDYQHLLADPEATYRNPKSVLRDIAYALDWADPESPVCVRTKLARTMAMARVKVFHACFAALEAQLLEEGVHPSLASAPQAHAR